MANKVAKLVNDRGIEGRMAEGLKFERRSGRIGSSAEADRKGLTHPPSGMIRRSADEPATPE